MNDKSGPHEPTVIIPIGLEFNVPANWNGVSVVHTKKIGKHELWAAQYNRDRINQILGQVKT